MNRYCTVLGEAIKTCNVDSSKNLLKYKIFKGVLNVSQFKKYNRCSNAPTLVKKRKTVKAFGISDLFWRRLDHPDLR